MPPMEAEGCSLGPTIPNATCTTSLQLIMDFIYNQVPHFGTIFESQNFKNTIAKVS